MSEFRPRTVQLLLPHAVSTRWPMPPGGGCPCRAKPNLLCECVSSKEVLISLSYLRRRRTSTLCRVNARMYHFPRRHMPPSPFGMYLSIPLFKRMQGGLLEQRFDIRAFLPLHSVGLWRVALCPFDLEWGLLGLYSAAGLAVSMAPLALMPSCPSCPAPLPIIAPLGPVPPPST